MPGDEAPEKVHTLPFVPPVFDWSAQNLYTQFHIFKTKVQFTFNGTYRNNSSEAKVGAILNWMGDSTFEVYNNFVWGLPADKSDPDKVLTQFKITSNQPKMSIIVGICSGGYIPLSSSSKLFHDKIEML